jgi:hypothetical protein
MSYLNANKAKYPFRLNNHCDEEYHVSNAQCKNQILVDGCSIRFDITANKENKGMLS